MCRTTTSVGATAYASRMAADRDGSGIACLLLWNVAIRSNPGDSATADGTRAKVPAFATRLAWLTTGWVMAFVPCSIPRPGSARWSATVILFVKLFGVSLADPVSTATQASKAADPFDEFRHPILSANISMRGSGLLIDR